MPGGPCRIYTAIQGAPSATSSSHNQHFNSPSPPAMEGATSPSAAGDARSGGGVSAVVCRVVDVVEAGEWIFSSPECMDWGVESAVSERAVTASDPEKLDAGLGLFVSLCVKPAGGRSSSWRVQTSPGSKRILCR